MNQVLVMPVWSDAQSQDLKERGFQFVGVAIICA